MPKYDFKVELIASTSYVIIQIEAPTPLDALNGFNLGYPGLASLTFISLESGGSISSSEIEVNIGSVFIGEHIFEISSSGVTTDNTVIVEVSNNVPTGKDADELELEPITVSAIVPQDGIIRFTINSISNTCLNGYYKVQYIII